MRIRHGGLSLDIPGHWSDQSTLLFVGQPTGPTLPSVNAVEDPPEAVAVTLVQDAGDGPRQVLQEESELLEARDPDFVLVDEGPFEAELGQGWHQVRKMTTAGVLVGQIAVAFLLGPTMVCASGSALDTVFEAKKAHLFEVLRSLRLEPASGEAS